MSALRPYHSTCRRLARANSSPPGRPCVHLKHCRSAASFDAPQLRRRQAHAMFANCCGGAEPWCSASLCVALLTTSGAGWAIPAPAARRSNLACARCFRWRLCHAGSAGLGVAGVPVAEGAGHHPAPPFRRNGAKGQDRSSRAHRPARDLRAWTQDAWVPGGRNPPTPSRVARVIGF